MEQSSAKKQEDKKEVSKEEREYKLQRAVLKMEKADHEVHQKEEEEKEKNGGWFRKLFNRKRSPQGKTITRQDVLADLERGVNDERKWNFLIVGIDELNRAIKEGKDIIFSGGASNKIDEAGNMKRNEDRDAINKKISELKKYFFDPQISQDTHGRDYIHKIDSKVEKAALEHSKKQLYEVNDRSLGGVTMLEIIRSMQREDVKRIIFFNNENSKELDFKPLGLNNLDKDKRERAGKAHKKEFLKAINSMRREVVAMLTDDGLVRSESNPKGNVRILYEEDRDQYNPDDKDLDHIIKITDNEPHLADLLDAYYQATKKKNVVIFFSGKQRNEEGEFDIKAKDTNPDLAKYKNEGKKMREMLRKYLEEDESSILAYSQKEVKKIVEEEF